MAGKGSLKLNIDGDASGLKKELSTVERSAKSAAAALAQEYKKAGMSLSEGMTKAWAEVNKAQKSGTTVVINGVETIIGKNKDVINQKDELGDVYDKLGNSAKNASSKVKAGLADIKAGKMYTGLPKEIRTSIAKNVDENGNITMNKYSRDLFEDLAKKVGFEAKNVIVSDFGQVSIYGLA